MRIDEIMAIADSDMSEKHRREQIGSMLLYRDWKKFGETNGITYKSRIQRTPSGHGLDILMVKDRTAIGYAILHAKEAGGFNGYIMTEIGLSRWEHEGNGYGKGLYDILLDHGFAIFSGIQQTRSGRKMWERLIARPDVEIAVEMEDGFEPLAPNYDPWNDPDAQLVARKKS